MDWLRFFGNSNPVELEVGCGKAGFLLRRARENPQINFLGIEWSNEFYKFAADRMQRHAMTNVRILRTDATVLLRTQCPHDSLRALHVYHPDPWPKKRHHKRRFFQPANLDAAVACRVPGGRLAVQTDHAEYFDVIRALLTAHPQFAIVDFFDAEFGAGEAGLQTNFEIKYRREGRSIYQIAARRVASRT